jgi:hypothetical protein
VGQDGYSSVANWTCISIGVLEYNKQTILRFLFAGVIAIHNPRASTMITTPNAPIHVA